MKITVNNLSKHVHDGESRIDILQNLSFEIPAQSLVAIVGRSGVGKSTLLQIMATLESPSSGSVHYGEREVTALSKGQRAAFRGQVIGFVFQGHFLLPEFTALENVSLPLIIAGVEGSVARAVAEQLLQRVGLSHRLSAYPGTLSGGEQQRVAIARALVAKPPVILADEPTGSLDTATASEIKALMLTLCREIGTTLIVVTHDLSLAQGMDRIYEMESGGVLKT